MNIEIFEEKGMISHSEDNRHHYGLLLEAASRLRENSDVNLLSNDGKVQLYSFICHHAKHGVPFVPFLYFQ